MSKQTLLIVASIAVLAGCASAPKTIPFNPAGVGGMEHRTLVPVTQAAPGFMPLQPSRAAFGVLGAAAMIAESKTYAAEKHIVDPSSVIEVALTQRLQNQYHLKAGPPIDMTGAPAKAPYPAAPGTLYIDAKVYHWGYAYFPMSWARYQVQYNTIIHLIDGASGGAVAQYDCKKVSHTDAATAPSLDDLLADKSALMNSTLEDMARASVAEFEAAVLTA